MRTVCLALTLSGAASLLPSPVLMRAVAPRAGHVRLQEFLEMRERKRDKVKNFVKGLFVKEYPMLAGTNRWHPKSKGPEPPVVEPRLLPPPPPRKYPYVRSWYDLGMRLEGPSMKGGVNLWHPKAGGSKPPKVLARPFVPPMPPREYPFVRSWYDLGMRLEGSSMKGGVNTWHPKSGGSTPPKVVPRQLPTVVLSWYDSGLRLDAAAAPVVEAATPVVVNSWYDEGLRLEASAVVVEESSASGEEEAKSPGSQILDLFGKVINKQIESKEAQLELVGKVVPTTKAPAPKKKAPKLRRKVSIKGAPAPDGYEWGATY